MVIKNSQWSFLPTEQKTGIVKGFFTEWAHNDALSSRDITKCFTRPSFTFAASPMGTMTIHIYGITWINRFTGSWYIPRCKQDQQFFFKMNISLGILWTMCRSVVGCFVLCWITAMLFLIENVWESEYELKGMKGLIYP